MPSSSPRATRLRPAGAAAPQAAAVSAVSAVAGPIVKWVGGKTRLLPEIAARLPRSYNRYFEPFAGGAAVFFSVAPRTAVLADSNPDLIGTYRAVAQDVEGVIRRLAIHREAHAEKHYYATRARWNDATVAWTALDRAAAFIYLNRTCYNGLWRVNRAGGFNVPMGRYKNPPICDADGLRAASRALARTTLLCADYKAAVATARAGDLVYFDPPYDPVTTTSNFVSYTAGAFGPDDQRALAQLAHRLAARGVGVVLSNSDTPFVRSLYKGLRVDRVRCARAINCNAERRGDVDEVLVMGGFETRAARRTVRSAATSRG
jgi:DNA adenine methylase